jgi:PhoH-like ATPase
MEKKTYILDTNVLLSDPTALFSFQEHDLVIPMIVLEELDRHKDRQDEVGRNARETSRKLTEITKDHKAFKDAVPLGAGLGRLYIMSINSLGFKDVKELLPSELEGKSGDNQILALCLALKKETEARSVETVLISRDVLLRLKANALGVASDDYKKLHVAKSAAGLYSGSAELTGDFDLESFYTEGKLELSEEVVKEFHENQYLNVTNPTTGSRALMRLKGNAGHKITEFAPCKINGKNLGQKCAIDALLDPALPLVTVVGQAGTGKTLLAIAAGLHQVLERKQYKSLIVCRPIQPLGKDIGFLPGTMEEKMEPWVAPIKDNLRYLLSVDGKKSKRGEETLQMLFENGTIEVEAMTFIRGRSIANAYIIIDEAQNLNAHELKTIITRVGEGTKIVLTGDIEQIDNMYVNSVSNGLTVAIEKFKSYSISGHVTLTKGERSTLATLAASIL